MVAIPPQILLSGIISIDCYAYDSLTIMYRMYKCVRVHLVTLEDILANGLPWKLSAVWQCASKLIKATEELHRIGILYLHWKGRLPTCYLQFQIYTIHDSVYDTYLQNNHCRPLPECQTILGFVGA